MWIKRKSYQLQNVNTLVHLETGNTIQVHKGEYVPVKGGDYERCYGVVLYVHGFNSDGESCYAEDIILPVKYTREFASRTLEKLAQKLGAEVIENGA